MTDHIATDDQGREIQFHYSGTFHNHHPAAFIDYRPFCPGAHKGCKEFVWDRHGTDIPFGQVYCVNETSCKVVHKPGQRPDICQLCQAPNLEGASE